MDAKMLGPEARPKPLSSFPNGVLKKHQHLPLHPRPHRPPPLPLPQADSLYLECLKNHAAGLGGQALDGCGEFMPSHAANPADPTSLKCAACGCHRNFHRRLPEPPLPLLLHRRPHHDAADEMDARDAAAVSDHHHHPHPGDDEDVDDDDEDDDPTGPRRSDFPGAHRSSLSPPPYSSAPHMLLALSSVVPNPARPITLPVATRPATAGPTPQTAGTAPGVGGALPRKRFRTKFSPEQKQRMQELSERLGWRIQKQDVGLMEERCREIGVGKGVFKVWMHNNKHTFLGTGRRGDPASNGTLAGGGAVATPSGGGGTLMEGSVSGGNNINHVVNGNPNSSCDHVVVPHACC